MRTARRDSSDRRPAVVDKDRWTIDVRHNAGDNDRVQVFYGSQRVRASSRRPQGNSIPGFGSVSRPFASILTVNATHMFGPRPLNEARFGRSQLEGGTFPASPLNPADFGIGNGVTRAIGLPQMIVAGALNFGGPGTLPQGRSDTSYVVVDTFSRASGRHSIRFGGEYRHFINENFAEGTGVFNFPSVEAFLAGTANAFNITLGERRSLIDQRAVGLFVQDQVAVHDTPHARTRDALRVARHAHRAGRPVRRLRRGERVAACASASTSTRSTGRTTGTSNRALGVAWSSRPTAAPCCAPRMPGPSTSQARRRSGTRPAIRRSPRR